MTTASSGIYVCAKAEILKGETWLGHHCAQRPGDDQNDLQPFPEHSEHHRQTEVSSCQPAPPSPGPGSGPSYLRCPRLRQICTPRAGPQPSWQTRRQPGRALTCTSSRKSSVFILKDTETGHDSQVLPAPGERHGVGGGSWVWPLLI